MPHRSQLRKQENQRVSPPITSINPDTATIARVGAAGRTIATMSTSGGTPPYTWSIPNAAGLSMAFVGADLRTTADPVGTLGLHTATITVTGALGMTLSESLAITVT